MLINLICKILKIVRIKTFIVFDDMTTKEINSNISPKIIYFKDSGEYYNVVRTIYEIVNDTLHHNWLMLEKTDPINNDKTKINKENEKK